MLIEIELTDQQVGRALARKPITLNASQVVPLLNSVVDQDFAEEDQPELPLTDTSKRAPGEELDVWYDDGEGGFYKWVERRSGGQKITWVNGRPTVVPNYHTIEVRMLRRDGNKPDMWEGHLGR